jgi:hypothetical protein
MARKRFGLLAAVVVALNLFLWLVPAGLAFRQSVIAHLFGPRLVRAEVIDATGGGSTADIRIDRGVVTAQSASQLTLQERDGRVQVIPLSASTQIFGRRNLRGWRVLAIWPANGTATTVQAEQRVGVTTGGSGHTH